MEKQRICKICNKRFSNGKAMGGHMRSHLAKLPIPPKPESPPLQQHHHHHHHHLYQLSDSPESSSPCPLFSSSYRGMHSSAVLNNREPSLDSAIHDGDSDSESHPRKPTRRRSKRRRKVIGKAAETPFEAEQVSSVSDTFSTEDVARCLIMLSMDKWEKVKVQKQLGEFADEDEEDEDDEEEDDSGFRARTQTGTRGKFKCETCNKAFRSYQALGGHRASHKKLKAPVFDEEEEDDFEEQDDVHDHGNARNFVVEQRRTFECSFCFKQFDSGQALGGHKKVHYYNQLINNVNVNARNVNANASSSSNNFVDNLVIDLNLPAPEEEEEDDEDEEVSQVEFSTVSE